MKGKYIFSICLLLLLGSQSCKQQSPKELATPTETADLKIATQAVAPLTITDLFRNSGRFFEMCRNAKGVYRDSKAIGQPDYHPCSVANVGMGLISLCIADKMGWTTTAQAQIITTLNTLVGNNPPFNLDVNAAGFPRHFVNMDTGAREWNSEYSTIDAAIMVEGALFCKKYFPANTQIAALTDKLYKSINWRRAIQDAANGKIWLELDAQGNGIGGTTSVYNEYINVAYLAFKSENGAGGPATTLWNKFYANPAANLPQRNYWGFNTLTDNPNNFLSSFVSQFSYYLCKPYSNNVTYRNFSIDMMRADRRWWSFQGVAGYEWGLGAGVSPGGIYEANAIENNPKKMVSPHIIAGFIPQSPAAATNLMNMYNAGKGIYNLPGTNYPVLWRYSLDTPTINYRATSISGVDFATELFGLATLTQHCGPTFFSTYSNFAFPAYTFVPI